ncbi:MAG: short-chain dehydrogenase [Planctomycetaceae bacterium]|nr:short-chain dehydrogenase [Planctomycetaceae bacterium]
MPQGLLKKVAVVTGGGRGIGKAIAEQFLAEGARVVVFGRTADELDRVVETAPARALSVVGDVTSPDNIAELADVVTRRFGRVDTIVPCAVHIQRVPFAEFEEADIRQHFEVNFHGAMRTVQQLLPTMNRGGSIILMTGFLEQSGLAGLSAFNASKAALRSAGKSLALELAGREIRVNCLSPGPTATSLWGASDNQTSTETTQFAALQSAASTIEDRLPRGQFASPKEIAETAVFLASDSSHNLNGQEIVVDGGFGVS